MNVEPPTVYKLEEKVIGSNAATYRAVTSTNGRLYYVVMASGTPETSITSKGIYEKTLANAITYGSIKIKRELTSVNIRTSFSVSDLEAQSEYVIAVYLNSTTGISDIVFQEFETAKASNGAAIKLAFKSKVSSIADLRKYLSYVLRIRKNRIFLLTVESVQVSLSSSFRSNVMNSRRFIYEMAIAPNRNRDIVPPITLVDRFKDSKWMKLRLKRTFLSDFIVAYQNPTREILMVKPRVRKDVQALEVSHKHAKVAINFWDQAEVYGVIVE